MAGSLKRLGVRDDVELPSGLAGLHPVPVLVRHQLGRNADFVSSSAGQEGQSIFIFIIFLKSFHFTIIVKEI